MPFMVLGMEAMVRMWVMGFGRRLLVFLKRDEMVVVVVEVVVLVQVTSWRLELKARFKFNARYETVFIKGMSDTTQLTWTNPTSEG